ncbi:MAG: hypothetical protein NTV52_02370 [Acidobacteria bacterium]|nr:hypothetical protein [Acidobacteriota bacterium]
MTPLPSLLFALSVSAAAPKARIVPPRRTQQRLASAALLLGLSASIAFAQTAAGDVRAQFNLIDPAVGPFPADQFTLPDNSQRTGLRIALPKPDCTRQPTDCEDIDLLNTLDGFNLQPRIAISFDGAINPYSVSSKTVLLVEFGGTNKPRLVGINQVFWDTLSNTLFVTSDESLPQSTQFALIATKGLLDPRGNPVQPAPEFTRYLASGSGDYRDRLRAGLDAAVSAGIPRDSIITASAFTTLTATAMLEKIRDQIHAGQPEPASFITNGQRTVFPRSAIASIVVHRHTRVEPTGFTDQTYLLAGLDQIPGSVGTVAFGTFSSPNYQNAQGIIPEVGTRSGTPPVQGTNSLVFSLILPSGPKPAKGWPVAIMGHYNSGSKEDIYLFASRLANRGLATIAINGPGHGFGPLGTADVRLTNGDIVTTSAGGRGVDVDRNNTIGNNEGFIPIGSPYALIGYRDMIRQTIADLMQMVRVIQIGMDMDGDGTADLDPARITYLGSSLGGNYGVSFHAIEPAIRASAFSFAGGSRADVWRLGANRFQENLALQARIPSLINSPGITRIAGLALAAPYFNENKPLRNQAPVINDVVGAVDIQRVLDHQNWTGHSADPVSFAPYIRKKPFAGNPPRPILIQMAKGDQTVPVPGQTAIVRSGDLADLTSYLRFDLVYTQNPGFPSTNPHIINTGTNAANGPLIVSIATGMQEQVAAFLATDGARIPAPPPAEDYEFPIKLPLPENLEYVNSGKALPPVDSAISEPALSPGSLFTLFGPTYSLTGEQSAGPGGLPTNLGGVTVSINGRLAPLSYVGPNQINGQIPYETVPAAAVAQVITNGLGAAEVPFPVTPVAPKLFLGQAGLCLARNHDGSAHSITNRAQSGRYLGAYLTGIGAVAPGLASGAPARGDVWSIPPGPVTASLAGRTVLPTFLGLVPGLVGVAEVDLVLPSDLPGGLHSLSITFGNATSNTCQIAVSQ